MKSLCFVVCSYTSGATIERNHHLFKLLTLTPCLHTLDQSWSAFDGLPFPPTASSQPSGRRWMTDSQETMANIYGWTACVFLTSFVVLFFGSGILMYLRSWFQGVPVTTGTIND
jgi:hypothetical protein